jgi:hypothetical protein
VDSTRFTTIYKKESVPFAENEIAFVIQIKYDNTRNSGTAGLYRGKTMKLKLPNKYTAAAILLMAVAAALVAIALNTNRGEFITAAFVISGMVCAITGIFVLTFSGGEPMDPRLVGILPAQGCLNLCRISSDLGITGNAYFLPGRITGQSRVMQFNPSSPYDGRDVSAERSFPKTGPEGLVTVPSCDLLIQDLKKRNALIIPDNEEGVTRLLRETISDIFEFAPRVSATWHGRTVTITFHRYRLIAGCQVIAQESPGCCTRNPCPVCSLCGTLIAEGTGRVVTINQCSISASKKDVIAVFQI